MSSLILEEGMTEQAECLDFGNAYRLTQYLGSG